jgi:hypothetical protein
LLAAAFAVGLALSRKAGPDGPEGQPPVALGPGGAAPRLRLLVPAYFYPGGEGLAEWERLLGAPEPAAIALIVNAASGPGKAADPNFARVIDRAREKGFTLVGYVSTRYAERPADDVIEDIDRWARFYPGVEGVFFDEQASAADRVEHYAGLYEYARKRRGLRLVVSNPGTVCAEGYLARPAADVVCLAESNRPLSEFRPPAWAARYPAERFAALLHKVTDPERMKRDVAAIADKRIGYCYFTNHGLPNPWDRLAVYWEAELGAVREVNERAGRQGP